MFRKDLQLVYEISHNLVQREWHPEFGDVLVHRKGSNYRQTVLTGFQQVEDNVAALRILEHEAQVQDKAVAAAQKYLELAIVRYKGGVTSYLEVTTAQSAALTDELTAVNILGRRMVDAVLLVQALGGGWNSSSLPQRPECCGKLTSTSR